MDDPDTARHLVLLAPSIDPDLEKTKLLQVFADHAWVRPLAKRFFPALNATNQEILRLKPELEKQVPRWADIQIPVTQFHGDEDDLVPIENLDFAARMLAHRDDFTPIRLAGRNHFIPWSDFNLIKKTLLDLHP